MRWGWGAAAIAAMAVVIRLSPWVHLGILAYHAVCAAGIVRHRGELRRLFARPPGVAAWTAATTLAFMVGLGACVFIVPAERYRDDAIQALFPWQDREAAFLGFAAYSLIVHAPLEEIFWRGVFTMPASGRTTALVLGNAVTFYAVHAAAMSLSLGRMGFVLALPTALAGAAWAFVTRRSASLWPAVVSHWIVDLAILGGVWWLFVRAT